VVLLAGSVVVWAVLKRWQGTKEPGRDRDKGVVARYLLLGLLSWYTLSVFLILDLAGSVSLHWQFVAIYAVVWVLVGLTILHPRPLREKILVLALFLVLILSIRFVDWNSRKPFLRNLERVSVGSTAVEADQIMAGYQKGVSPFAQVDEQGSIVRGTVSYRHTTEGWGNSDLGLLTFESGLVAGVKYLPD
jgi:hypothetical protein